jgi:hypothetical protein
MNIIGKVLGLALPCFLFFMSIGACCAFAFPANVPGTLRTPAKAGMIWRPGAHTVLPASAMHPLRAPVRGRNNPFTGRIVQGEKHVLIHGAELVRFRRSDN